MEETEEEEPRPEMKVTLLTTRESRMVEGDTVMLTAITEGFDGYEVMYQWKCNKGDGFEVAFEGFDNTYSFEANQ